MNVYHEHIMEHAKRPFGQGTLVDANCTLHDTNPLCGDEITVTLRIEGERIRAARHTSAGCAISQAGTSIVFEQLEGLALAEALALDKEQVLSAFGSELSVSRVKCALLGFTAVKKALVAYEEKHAHH